MRWASSLMPDWRRSRYSAVPNASTVTARATVYHRVSRRRMVVMSGLHDVPDAAHRVHQLLRVTGIDFLPEPIDNHVHDVGSRVEVIVPGVFSDQSARHHAAGVPHQILQYGVLLWSEVDPLPRASHLARRHVELQIAD